MFNYSPFQVMMESIRAIIVCHRLGKIHLISFCRTIVRSYNSTTKFQTYEDVLSNDSNHKACPSKNLEKVWDIENLCNIAKFRKMKSKNDRVPTFFYVPNFFYVFFPKNIEICWDSVVFALFF